MLGFGFGNRDVVMNERSLHILAELNAHRALLVRLQVLRLLTEPDPLSAAQALRHIMTSQPVEPPSTDNPFDPATSDLLASATDERIEAIMGEVIQLLEQKLAISPA